MLICLNVLVTFRVGRDHGCAVSEWEENQITIICNKGTSDMCTHKNLELGEASFDLTVPYQDRRFVIKEEPYAESSRSVVGV